MAVKKDALLKRANIKKKYTGVGHQNFRKFWAPENYNLVNKM